MQGQRHYRGHDAGPWWWRSSCGGRRLGESRCHAVGHDSRHEYFWSPVRCVLIVSILPTLFNLLVSLSPLCNWKKQNNYKSTTLPTGCVCTVYIYITSFHIRLRGVLWLQNWKSCCQEHRQFGSVRIYHLAGFCAWPLWHQWLGTRNPHLFNHLGSLEIPSFSSFFQKLLRLDLHALRG